MLIASGTGTNVGSKRTRPIKFRAACTQCNGAKVKCSGERTGCERCRDLDLQCIYMESRVGKVPGVRARKKSIHQHTSIAQLNAQDGTYMIAPVQQVSTLSPSSTSAPTLIDDSNDPVLQWTTDNDQGPYTDFLDETPNSHVAHQSSNQLPNSASLPSSSSTSSEPSMPALEFDIDDLLRYPLEQDQHITTPVPAQQLEEQDTRRRAELDSQCVMLCCQIASELESYMVADIKSLRIVLGIVRKGVERLNEAVGLQQGSRNFRCMAMFGVIIYQIIELLESGCSCFIDVNGNCKDNFTAQIQGMLPGLTLGGFGMNPEEQSAWRSHIVLKEIQQSSETLQKIKKLMVVGENGTSKGPSTPEERERCFVDMENRLRTLSEKVAARK
ncbi:hypothetical protein CC78DRAFT_580144 [Lojkania enalia]|uniref:Zn(2)-C6 fungal-type domain-containing protein n=1 Tax=Lojkania enalia TaxID=147567 RepID=A0A9P4N4D7_9PLEO|nr:hypothetical protein CC78DRAFT_580144 [Didymosphaeria enalia]